MKAITKVANAIKKIKLLQLYEKLIKYIEKNKKQDVIILYGGEENA
jgi:hypothetical protein